MTLVLLAGLSAGVLQDAHGNIIPGRQVNVYARGTSTPVQVYADSAGSSPVTQPLTTDSSGQVPGYVAGGVSIDIVDALTGLREQGEPVSANAVARTIATTYLTPSGGDDSAAMVAALAAGGTIVMGPGTFLWNTSVPAFARSTPTRVVGAGIGNTIIKLSSGAPRAFDFLKVADYDTFSDIGISDLTIDVNSIGGRHHIVIGNYANGGQSTKINVARLTVQRVRTINVPTDITTINHRLGIFIAPIVNISTDNPCALTDIFLQDLDFLQGGNMGVSIGGTKSDGNAISNLSWDRITCTRVKHDTGVVPTATYSSCCIQIGSQDIGGTAIIRDCYSANAGDLGIGVLNAQYGLIDNCVTVDDRNCGFQVQGFMTTPPEGQQITFRGCHAKIVNMQTNAAGPAGDGFVVNGAANVPLGEVIIDGCSFTSHYAQFGAAAQAINASLTANVKKLTIRDFSIDIPDIADTAGGGGNAPTLVVIKLTGNSLVKIQNLRCSLVGSTTNTNVIPNLIQIGAGANADMHVDIDGVQFDNRMTGVIAASYSMTLAAGTTTGTLHGKVQGIDVLPGWTGQNPTAIVLVQTAAAGNTVSNLTINDSDFSELPGGTDLVINQAGSVRTSGIKYRVAPAPSNITGLVTATGTTSGKSYPGVWTFKQGTGAAITAIDYSTDGGTTYTNFLTQASAALPAGFDQSLGPLPADALVKVTFTTTQPTITLVPSAP